MAVLSAWKGDKNIPAWIKENVLMLQMLEMCR